MTKMRAWILRIVLACAAALLAVGVMIRQQAACQGCEPGEFLYDNPVGCDFNCNVTFAGKLTGQCNTNCEASILEGWCTGTKGNCEFHRDWTVISCFGPPQDTPVPTAIPTDTPVPTPTSTSTPAPTPTPLPPTLHSEVTCAVPGSNGWCRGGAYLRLSASDPQGMTVSIEGEINGSAFACGSSCDLSLPEGVGSASFTAMSGSGRSASGSEAWKLDSAAPAVDAALQGGTLGNNGWYTSGPVGMTCMGSDATSGMALIEYRADGGAWGDAASVVNDGNHTLECRASDAAGNTSLAGEDVKIDSVPPTTHILLADNAWLAGAVGIGGRTEDAVSGVAGVAAAVDSPSTWSELGNASDWIYSWDTRGSVDGSHVFMAHGEDQAGNVENSQVVPVRVDNSPPVVSMASSWVMGGAGEFDAQDAGVGIESVRAVVSGPGIQQRVLTYSQPPSEIRWDGMDGYGVAVGYGTYQVEVTVCDLLANCAVASAEILNQPPPPPTATRRSPTATPTATVTPTTTATITPTSVVATARPTQSNRVTSQEPNPAPVLEAEEPEHWMIWPFVGLLGLIVTVGTTYAMDRRTRELRNGWIAWHAVFIRSEQLEQEGGEE